MYEVRPFRPSDLTVICRHRERMFAEAGSDAASLGSMAEPFRQWLAPRLNDGRYFGWLVEANGAAVAGIGMMVIEWPPHPSHPTYHQRGYIFNVFVEPARRRSGLASRLMRMANDEAKRRGITYMVLHATEQGRQVYERIGWRPTTEMAIAVS